MFNWKPRHQTGQGCQTDCKHMQFRRHGTYWKSIPILLALALLSLKIELLMVFFPPSQTQKTQNLEMCPLKSFLLHSQTRWCISMHPDFLMKERRIPIVFFNMINTSSIASFYRYSKKVKQLCKAALLHGARRPHWG